MRTDTWWSLSAVVLLLLGLIANGVPACGAEEKEPTVEGKWFVVSVELAGQRVEGLDGAELTMAQRRKTFKLPSGVVEKGTYTLDPMAIPKQIDSTTEGRGGIENGIHALENGTLKLCLASGGGPRSANFATRPETDLILIVLKRVPTKQKDDHAFSFDKPSGSRNFRMGFTGFVYDTTFEAVMASRKFCPENGDILAHHIAIDEQSFETL